MNKAELHQHPAFLALAPEEQAAVDERLQTWQLDAAVAATTGGLASLEADDLRFWLASTRCRPWAMISLCRQPEQADAIFASLLTAAPDIAERPLRAELTGAARALSRAFVLADAARAEAGFVRDEQLAALWRQLEQLGQLDAGWSEELVLGAARSVDLGKLVDALLEYRHETTGVRGFFDRLGQRLRTKAFDLAHGGLFIATGSPDHEGRYEDGVWRNWTANYEVRPRVYRCPGTEQELANIVAEARELRVVGGGHTFNDSPLCPDTLISLDAYDAILAIDGEAGTARVQAGIRLRDLNKALAAAGLGLPVLGSTDAQSIAGLIATDLHGSGREHGFLSEQVLSLRIIAADGSAQTVRRGDPLFHAAFGALGCCGVVCEVELQLVPAFNLEKTTAMVDRVTSEDEIEALLRANDHVSFYYVGGGDESESVRVHEWNHTDAPVSEGWEKRKIRAELSDFAISAFMPWAAELIADIDEDSWLSNLLAPDHRLIMPGSQGFGRKLFYRHDEIEYGIPFGAWHECLTQVMEHLRRHDYFSIVEVRFTPDNSQALLGPGVGRRTAYIELATPLGQERDRIYAEVEEIFWAFGGQPHLGKKTNVTAQRMLEIYGERFIEFQAVRARQDPSGKLLNPFTQRVFGP